MYLYFDNKGVLLEIINDEALRQYNHQVNTMYVYIENTPTAEFPKGLSKLQYWFERPNGDVTAVYDTLSHPGDVIVTETIPFNIKRDVRKFQYGVKYKMFKIEMPSGRIIGQDESGNPVYEYNIFEDDGPVSLTIKAIFVEGAKELTLGKVVFTIEKEVVIPSDSISVSQFEYILRAIDALTFTVGEVTTETLDSTSEASVTVTQDKSSTELKNYPIDFDFKIPRGATPNIVANATVDENVGVPEVNVTKTGTDESPTFTFNFRNLRGKDAEIPSGLTNHLTDYSNPHKTTAEQVGAVPVDFRSFSAAPTTTKNFRQSAELFVGNNGNGFRMTLQDVKNMGTKIVTVNDMKDVDFDKLDVGDYIYSKI